MLPHRHLLVPDPASGSPPMDADDPSSTSSSAPPTSDATTSSSSPPASDAAFVDAPAAATSSSAPPASDVAFVDAPATCTSSSAPPASDAAFVDAPAACTSSSAPPSSDAAFVDAPAAGTSFSAPPASEASAFVDAPAAGTSSSAPPASEAAAFFDAPDALSTPPTPPPHHPHTPSSSTLRRRARRAKILNQTDDLLSSSASAASTVTAADEPDKYKVEPKPKPEPEPDSSEASSASRSPPSLEEEVDDKDSQPTSPESESGEKHAEPEAAARDHRPTAPAPAPAALESLAVLIVKAVVFQFSALVACLAFPFRLLQWWYLFVTDPLGSAQRAKDWALGVAAQATGTVTAALGAGDGVGRVAVRLVCGALWALYVCGVLCALLFMAFLAGGFLVGKVVEEPVQMTENLNFDYTKPSPVAFVPVPQLVPPHQRMQLEVSLTLPESDYNRRLGVFQVRAELLSADGKVVSASSQPCMLKFKSVHMHFIETFLQSVSLLSGYSSESQVINLKMTGIKKAFEPITGVRIVLEQRAEFSRGAGIPEIYDASLKLEAELPLLKRLLWHWRWTLFVWSSMAFFVFEMFLAVVCCRPCIFPRTG